MKQVKRAVGVVILGALLTQAVDAELVPSIQAGNRLFSDISIHQQTLGSGNVPSTDELIITGTQVGNNFGINVGGNWQLNPYTVSKLWISYTVSVLPGHEDQLITGSSLSALPFSTPHGSTFSVNSRIYGLAAEPCDSPLSQFYRGELYVDQDNPSESTRLRRLRHTGDGINSLYVETMVSIFGGCEGTEFNGFQESFQQVPEPASMGMLAAGSVFSLVLRNKSRKRRGNQPEKIDSVLLDPIAMKKEAAPQYFYSGRIRLKRPVF